jgi:hypothetical protein
MVGSIRFNAVGKTENPKLGKTIITEPYCEVIAKHQIILN